MNRRWWWLLLLIPVIFGWTRLRFDVAVLNLLPSGLPMVDGLKLHQEYFADTDELILTLRASSPDVVEQTADALAAQLCQHTNLVRSVLWRAPWQENPGDLAELVAIAWLNQSPQTFQTMASRLAPEAIRTQLETARNALATSLSPEEITRLSYDPLGISQLPSVLDTEMGGFHEPDRGFASADGCFRMLFVKPSQPAGSYRSQAAWVNAIRTLTQNHLGAMAGASDVVVQFTGTPAFVAETAIGMENDMRRSVGGTLAVIAVLFWLAHRRWRPLLCLVLMLVVVVAGCVGLGGLIFGPLNVVSLGFAAILLGLSADYALVLYQEAVARPDQPSSVARREVARGIVWSAVTTAGAFVLLNFGGLPGLAQLGTLVAVGILFAAVVMLFVFPPLAMPHAAQSQPNPTRAVPTRLRGSQFVKRYGKQTTVALLVLSALILIWRPPTMDRSTSALSPTESQAFATMQDVEATMGEAGSGLWLLVMGRTEQEIANHLTSLQTSWQRESADKHLGTLKLPIALWPHPEHQAANLSKAHELGLRREQFRELTAAAGFTEEAFQLVDAVLETWQGMSPEAIPVMPASQSGRWILQKAAARTPNGWIVLGLIDTDADLTAAAQSASEIFKKELPDSQLLIMSWELLGGRLLEHSRQRLTWIVSGMLAVVAACLTLTFGRQREVLLSFGTLLTSFALLLAIMSMLGWSWNLMNLMAAPLLLGAGVDYTIHLQLALRRNAGDLRRVWHTTGRALLLCAATTFVAFSSLAWAGNAGLAGLGRVCAAGVGCMLFVSLVLLPAWWIPGESPEDELTRSTREPSLFYRAGYWRFGLGLVRILPDRVCGAAGRLLGRLYHAVALDRREIVVQNLLPVHGGNRLQAQHAARELFGNFGQKIADLLRYESGVPVQNQLRQWTGWEHFEAALARQSGILLVTPHVGNWEFGAAFLASKNIKLLVLTQAEPGQGFTELRQQSRARRGIETMVVGEDAFAFVEVIKRLQAGETVALLIDRPPPSTAAQVELFGRPFNVSIAAAELARASGCTILPVYVIREQDGYGAHALPEVSYDRSAIGDRDHRVALAEKILRAFAPVIRQHSNQWYHFVSIWRDNDTDEANPET